MGRLFIRYAKDKMEQTHDLNGGGCPEVREWHRRNNELLDAQKAMWVEMRRYIELDMMATKDAAQKALCEDYLRKMKEIQGRRMFNY